MTENDKTILIRRFIMMLSGLSGRWPLVDLMASTIIAVTSDDKFFNRVE